MLVASKKKVQTLFFPTVDYERKTLDDSGKDKKVVSKVGFYEIEKRKFLKVDKKTNEVKRGDIIKEEFVETEDENNFKKIPYSGKTLIISIENSRFTRSTRPAEEQDKITYKEAYEAHLAYKAEEEKKDAELKEAKEKLAKLEAAEAKKKDKNKTDEKTA